jgi:ATP-dependent RNA helicase SUPV3L1/SUV3
VETPAETSAEAAPAQAAAVDSVVAETTPVIEAATEPAAEEPVFIEVWRPVGRSERRMHRPRRPPRLQQSAPAMPPAEGSEVAATPAIVAATSDDRTESSSRLSAQPHSYDRQARRARHDRQQRADRQQQRSERKESHQIRNLRRDRPRRKRDDGPDRAEREQYYAKPYGSGGDRRDKQPDPNSPFAKLAALKQELEQNRKEPS